MNKIFIYLDESGDLGFNKGSSKYFVISFIAMDTKTNLILKRKIKKVKKRHKIGKDVEIKANKSNHSLRVDVLKEICSLPIEIYSITTKKQGINKSLRYLVLLWIACDHPHFSYIVSRYTTKSNYDYHII